MRRLAFPAVLLALSGCGIVPPSEGQMQAAILRNVTKAYNPGAQIEFFNKVDCAIKLGKGYFCHFQLTTNLRRIQYNEGLFFYHNGWQVKNFGLNPNTPS